MKLISVENVYGYCKRDTKILYENIYLSKFSVMISFSWQTNLSSDCGLHDYFLITIIDWYLPWVLAH